MKKIIMMLLLGTMTLTSAWSQRIVRNAFTQTIEQDSNRTAKDVWWEYKRNQTKAVLINGDCTVLMDGYIIKGNFNKGLPTNCKLRYYAEADSTIRFERQFNELGELDGAAIDYFDDGTPKRYVEFKKDKCNGKHQEWYTNGQISFDGIAIDNVREGTGFAWCSDGRPMSEWNYKNGKRQGKCITWIYNDSIAVGKNVELFNQDVNVDSTLYYSYGVNGNEELTSRITYDDSGEIKLMETYKDDTYNRLEYEGGEFSLSKYYIDGHLVSIIPYLNNNVEGEAIAYYPGTEILYRIELYHLNKLIAKVEYDIKGNVSQYKVRDAKGDLVTCSKAEFEKAKQQLAD